MSWRRRRFGKAADDGPPVMPTLPKRRPAAAPSASAGSKRPLLRGPGSLAQPKLPTEPLPPSDPQLSNTEYRVVLSKATEPSSDDTPRLDAPRVSLLSFDMGHPINLATLAPPVKVNVMNPTEESMEEEAIALSGAGAIFGQQKELEARRRRRQRAMARREQLHNIELTDASGRRFVGQEKSTRESKHAYYVLVPDDNDPTLLRAMRVSRSFHLAKARTHRQISLEEAEMHLQQRSTVMEVERRFKSLQKQDEEEDDGTYDMPAMKLRETDATIAASALTEDDFEGQEAAKSKRKHRGGGQQRERLVDNADDDDVDNMEDGFEPIDSDEELPAVSDIKDRYVRVQEAEAEESAEAKKKHDLEGDIEDDDDTAFGQDEEEEEEEELPSDLESVVDEAEEEAEDEDEVDSDFDADKEVEPSSEKGRSKSSTQSQQSRSGADHKEPAAASAADTTTLAAQKRKAEDAPTESAARSKKPKVESSGPTAASLASDFGFSSTLSQSLRDNVIRYLNRKPLSSRELMTSMKKRHKKVDKTKMVRYVAALVKEVAVSRKHDDGQQYYYIKEAFKKQ